MVNTPDCGSGMRWVRSPSLAYFILLGYSQAVRQGDFDSLMRWFESSYPSYYLPAWRNWQTRWTQKSSVLGRAGSTPAAGIVLKTRFSDLVFFFIVEFVTLSYLKLLVL